MRERARALSLVLSRESAKVAGGVAHAGGRQFHCYGGAACSVLRWGALSGSGSPSIISRKGSPPCTECAFKAALDTRYSVQEICRLLMSPRYRMRKNECTRKGRCGGCGGRRRMYVVLAGWTLGQEMRAIAVMDGAACARRGEGDGAFLSRQPQAPLPWDSQSGFRHVSNDVSRDPPDLVDQADHVYSTEALDQGACDPAVNKSRGFPMCCHQ